MIYEKTYHTEAIRSEVENESYLDGRIGFWGRVTSVDAESMTCSVYSDTKFEYKDIPVACKEWVSENEEFVSAERNLPPVGAVVFVLTPTKTISGAFILCSGYSRGDENLHTLYSNFSEKDKKATLREKKTCSGWTISEDYETGRLSLNSHDEQIQIAVSPTDNLERDSSKEISIKAWNTKIQITDKGLFIQTDGDSSIRSSGDMDISVGGSLLASIGADLEAVCEGNLAAEIKGKSTLTVTDDIEINAEGKNITLNADSFAIGESFEVTK